MQLSNESFADGTVIPGELAFDTPSTGELFPLRWTLPTVERQHRA